MSRCFETVDGASSSRATKWHRHSSPPLSANKARTRAGSLRALAMFRNASIWQSCATSLTIEVYAHATRCQSQRLLEKQQVDTHAGNQYAGHPAERVGATRPTF